MKKNTYGLIIVLLCVVTTFISGCSLARFAGNVAQGAGKAAVQSADEEEAKGKNDAAEKKPTATQNSKKEIQTKTEPSPSEAVGNIQ